MNRQFFGQVGKLKPEKVATYVELHKRPWPGVLRKIKECNIENYSIFLLGDLVFAYFEYVGTSYRADMELMAGDPETQEWWTHTKPCFESFAWSNHEEYYADMKQIFYLQ
jgi:L-rhamnose mutarotase